MVDFRPARALVVDQDESRRCALTTSDLSASFLTLRLRIATLAGDKLEADLLGTALRRATDVEGPHGQLGARLTDRLGRDDADRFADVHRTARQVAAVAVGADAARLSQVSGERMRLRSDAGGLDDFDIHSEISVPALTIIVARDRIDDVFGDRHTAENPFASSSTTTSPPSTTADGHSASCRNLPR